jgi:hypothetical protein
MPRVALWFFAVAPIYVIMGMCLGIYMGAANDESLFPVHAHLNLLGWVTMGLCGAFYALAREASKKLAWTVFALLNIGTLMMVPSLALLLKIGPQPADLVPLFIASFLLLGGMVTFALSVWAVLLKQARGSVQAGVRATPMAAE